MNRKEKKMEGDGLVGTSDGDVGEAVGAADVDGVGEDPEERLGDEGEVAGVLDELERGGGEAEAAREVEVERQPREAAEPLHQVPEPAHPPHRRISAANPASPPSSAAPAPAAAATTTATAAAAASSASPGPARSPGTWPAATAASENRCTSWRCTRDGEGAVPRTGPASSARRTALFRLLSHGHHPTAAEAAEGQNAERREARR